jgi:hypothetical protein
MVVVAFVLGDRGGRGLAGVFFEFGEAVNKRGEAVL